MTKYPHALEKKTRHAALNIIIFGCLYMSALTSAAVQVIPKGGHETPSQSAQDTQLSSSQLKSNFKKAVSAYRAELRAYWPDAEISSKTRLVFYSDDYQQKQAVDFKANEIQVTMPSLRQGKVLNYREMQKRLEKTLIQLLSTNLQTAVNLDPINSKMETLAGIRYAQDLGAMGRDLILGELFRDERPSIKAVERMAKKLSKAAYIRYPAVKPGICL